MVNEGLDIYIIASKKKILRVISGGHCTASTNDIIYRCQLAPVHGRNVENAWCIEFASNFTNR